MFSAGVLDAFMINNFNPFDIYIGVSSGAMCLSYYIANQYKSYVSLSKEVCVNDKFLSYTNALSEEGYMNLKYLTQYAVKNNPLDLVQISENTKDKQFYVVATNVDNGKPVYLEPNKKNIYRCIRATSSLPFFTKGFCKIDGLNLIDGGWSDPIPAKSAVKFGSNKIIVIRPNPKDYKVDSVSYLGLIGGYWWRSNPKLSNRFFTEHDDYNQAVSFLNKNHKSIEICQICPDKSLNSSVIGTSVDDLIHDYHCGLEKGMDFLNSYLKD